MTREIALHCMKSYSELHSDLCELCPIYGETGSDHCFEDALQYVIGMLEQEPTTKENLAVDAISRADVLKLMQDNWHTHNGDWAMQESMDDIRALPPVTPIRPKGHWINKHCFVDSWSCNAECSSCHKRSNGYIHNNGYGLESTYDDFCPKCGSNNREVEE